MAKKNPPKQSTDQIRANIMSEWFDFAHNNLPIESYRAFLKKTQKDYPKQFAQIQQENTDAKLKKLDDLAFGRDTLPFDATIADVVTPALDVVYGSEGESSVGGYRGLTDLPTDKVWLAGAAPPNTTLHEGLHLFSNHLDNTRPTNSFTGKKITNEMTARAFDVLRGLAERDGTRVQEAVDYVNDERTRKQEYTASELTKMALDALNQFYDSNMIEKDPEGLKEALSYFDEKNQGFISSLLFDPEKLDRINTEFYYGRPLEPEDLGKFSQLLQADKGLAFQSTPQGNLMNVFVDLDRTGLESTIK